MCRPLRESELPDLGPHIKKTMGVRHSSQIMVDIIKWVNRLSPLKQIFDSEALTLSRCACLEQCFSTLLLEAHKAFSISS